MNAKSIVTLRPLILAIQCLGLFLANSVEHAGKAQTSNAVARHAFFANAGVHRVELTLSAEDMAALRAKPYDWSKGEIRLDGALLEKTGIHLKGHGTLRDITNKPSFTIKANQYTKGARLAGLRKFTLEYKPLESSYLRSAICREIFHLAQVPAPRVTYADVSLNGTALGLYVLGEAVTQDFLQDHFGTRTGTVWEGEAKDLFGPLEIDYEESVSVDAVSQVARLCGETNLDRRFRELEKWIDVDEVASHIAAEVFCNSSDGYAAHFGNYRLYYSPGKTRLSLIPNLIDLAFNDPRAPILPDFNGMLARGLVATPTGRKIYLEKLSAIAEQVYASGYLFASLSNHCSTIQGTLRAQGGNILASQQHNAEKLANRLTNRTDFVRYELQQLGLPGKQQALNTNP